MTESEEPKCFKCGKKPGRGLSGRNLIPIYGTEIEDDSKSSITVQPEYETKKRLICLRCLNDKIEKVVQNN